jgi:hypothetical protein
LFEGFLKFPKQIIDDFRLPADRHILTVQDVIWPAMIPIILATGTGKQFYQLDAVDDIQTGIVAEAVLSLPVEDEHLCFWGGLEID